MHKNTNLTKGAFSSSGMLAMSVVVCLLASTAELCRGELVMQPDENTLWMEDFRTLEIDEDRVDGWWHFDEVSAEIVGGAVRLRQVGERRWGNFQRYVPYDFRPGHTHRYLQVKVDAVEDAAHHITLANASTDGLPMGRPFEGITTVDLSAQPFAATEDRGTFALTLTQWGHDGTEPGGWLDVNWIRVVDVPYEGLTMTLEKSAEADAGQQNVAEVGDTIHFHYHSRQPLLEEQLRVRLYAVSHMGTLQFDADPQITLEQAEGQEGHVYTHSVVIGEDASRFEADTPGTVVATATVDGVERHALAAFGFAIETDVEAGAALEASTPRAREYRSLWQERTVGENLALGRPVAFSRPPSYRLTQDDNDPYDLTDGSLASRTDDKIWFARDAVGWQTGADHGVNLLLDLGERQPIGRVVLRTLGGGEQGSLLFPRELVVVVSDDGENFHRVASLNKLMPGEKDQADRDGVFYLPEEGQAYVYPFTFDELNVNARYVGLQVIGSSSFLFMDQLAVIEADEPAEALASPEEHEGMAFVMDGIVVAPFHGTVALSTNIMTPHWFRLIDMRASEDQDNEVVYVFELPEQIELHTVRLASGGAVEQAAIERDGRGYIRWRVRKPWVFDGYFDGYNMGDFHFAVTGDAAALEDTYAYIYAESAGYEPNEIKAPIRAVEIPEVPRLERLHVSLAWMTEDFALRWPNFLDTWEHLGFNAVSTFPRYWPEGQPTPEIVSLLEAARERDMAVIHNESPFHVMYGRRQDEPEIFSQLADGPSSHTCPAYRGEFYQEEVERVGELAALSQPDYIFYDIELWYPGAREANACERCREDRAERGLSLQAFLATLGTEMVRDLNEQVRRASEAEDFPMPTIGLYDNHALRPIYHLVYDFEALYPEHLDLAQPSLYVRGDAPTVQETVRRNYELLGEQKVLPWLSAGTYGEFEPHKLEAMILETFLNGGNGITYFWFGDFDSALDWYYHARALKLLAPHERLLDEGTMQEVDVDNDTLFYSAWGDESEILLLVGNYQNSSRTQATITLPFSNVKAVTELREETAVDASSSLRTDVQPQQIKLYHIQYE